MKNLNEINEITTTDTNIINIVNSNDSINTPATLQIKTTVGDRATLKLLRQDLSKDLSSPDTVFGRVVFERSDVNGHGANSIIVGGSNFLLLGNRENTVGHLFPEEGVFIISNHKNFGIGTKRPSPNARLDINGITKLRVQTKEPTVSEVGMIAIVDGTSEGWDPNGQNSKNPYPVFFDGKTWREIVLK